MPLRTLSTCIAPLPLSEAYFLKCWCCPFCIQAGCPGSRGGKWKSHVLPRRQGDAGSGRTLVCQRHRDGGKPLSSCIGRTVCHILRYDADLENPACVQRVGALCHSRRQNGALHVNREVVEIHTRRCLYPYAADCVFGEGHVLSQLVNKILKIGD